MSKTVLAVQVIALIIGMAVVGCSSETVVPSGVTDEPAEETTPDEPATDEPTQDQDSDPVEPDPDIDDEQTNPDEPVTDPSDEVDEPDPVDEEPEFEPDSWMAPGSQDDNAKARASQSEEGCDFPLRT